MVTMASTICRCKPLSGWKRAWEAGEAESEPKVRATLKRYAPTVEKRMLGGVGVLDIKPSGWKQDGKVLVHLHGGARLREPHHRFEILDLCGRAIHGRRDRPRRDARLHSPV